MGRPGRAAPGESLYSAAAGREICAAVAAGRSLMSVCGEPGRPHRTTIRNWERSHPEFAEALRSAYREARVSVRMRDRQRAAERALRPPPRRGGKASGYTRALGEAICARLVEGESLTAIGRDPDMPCYGTILAWVKRHPAFEDMYVAARAAQAERLTDEARDLAAAATMADVPVSRLRFDVLRWLAARVAAKKYEARLETALAIREAEAAEMAAREAGSGGTGAGGAADGAPRQVVFTVTRFERGPDGRVLAAPPRDAGEAQAWVESTGRPYATGVGPNGEIRPPMDTPEGWARRDAYVAAVERAASERRAGRRR
ncbi:MAG: hypothetical protein ABS78_23205 [Phenylobacterium sp. SCN 70-31]|nr:MAG: hypothetical protein ABS78_23205 [Phenylobacterium sp. SCN 70-31]